MSLTTLLKLPEVKSMFRETFPVPAMDKDTPMKAKPKTENYKMIGTAFDYLLRFHIQFNNKRHCTVSKNGWIADSAMLTLYDLSKKHKVCYHTKLKTEVIIDLPPDEYKDKGIDDGPILISEKYLQKAKDDYSDCFRANNISKDLLESSIRLAQMDGFYRSHILKYSDINYGDIADLKCLVKVASQSNCFTGKHYYLNPTFGSGSLMVGGADSDLIMDDTLIDIKTTKFLKFRQAMYNQVIGYYLLWKKGKSDKSHKLPTINNVGIYFSRHGLLYTIPVEHFKSNITDEFLDWFKTTAEKHTGIGEQDLQYLTT
ncbi:MAG: hypothetical protein D9C04_06135 [Nitrosopumilus sp. B06]|nr:MAG: hypothetical protein D9C04_06135 [Nitrosopumilus sp. B06]